LHLGGKELLSARGMQEFGDAARVLGLVIWVILLRHSFYAYALYCTCTFNSHVCFLVSMVGLMPEPPADTELADTIELLLYVLFKVLKHSFHHSSDLSNWEFIYFMLTKSSVV
jgi:hypothetical protein